LDIVLGNGPGTVDATVTDDRQMPVQAVTVALVPNSAAQAKRYDLYRNACFQTEVTDLRWDDDGSCWIVSTSRGDRMKAHYLVMSNGPLNRPKLPSILGIESFRGAAMHSAAWDHDIDVAGRRVAVIGTGASAFQIVPTIAERCASLTVFQRSAPWMFPNPNYHAKVGPGKKWALEHLPYYGRWYRFLLFWPGCDGGLDAMRVDPTWPHQERAVSALNDATREAFTQYLKDQVGDDAELLRKVIPDYVCLGKRTLQDNGSWLAALKRSNVRLVDDPIERIEADAVVTASGARHDVDVIVYATGFHANRFLWPMDIRGRSGHSLAETWGDAPSAYLGITVPDFPNFFCMYGPGTNLAHGGSLVFHSECQIHYALDCIHQVLASGARTIEVRKDAHDEYVERYRAEIDQLVWSHPSIEHSHYKNRQGKIFTLSPWRLELYWEWTRSADPGQYVVA